MLGCPADNPQLSVAIRCDRSTVKSYQYRIAIYLRIRERGNWSDQQTIAPTFAYFHSCRSPIPYPLIVLTIHISQWSDHFTASPIPLYR